MLGASSQEGNRQTCQWCAAARAPASYHRLCSVRCSPMPALSTIPMLLTVRPVPRPGAPYRLWCRDAECSLASRNGRTETKRHRLRGKGLASRSGASARIHAIALGAGPCASKDLEANGGHNGHYRSPAAGAPDCRAVPRNISRPIGFGPPCPSQYAHGRPWPTGARRDDSPAARPARRTPSAVPTYGQRQTSRCDDDGNC